MAKLSKKADRQRMDSIIELLNEMYPDARAGLDFANPFQLLIATILSAQCTDKQVNKVTPALFGAYPHAQDIAPLSYDQLEPYIKSCGFYVTKAKNIVNTCRILTEEYGGEVPADMDKLQQLPGVGRKTANVVVSNAFGMDAIAVDTHVFRVANRLGLAHAQNELNTEKQLMENIPKERWSEAHHWLIWHGRRICGARNPKCEQCRLAEHCEYFHMPAAKKKPAAKASKSKKAEN